MAIKFFNIRSKEVQVADTEPKIAALWSSSDHSPNITQGQDFGWRLAPEVVVAMKRIKQDQNQLMIISSRYSVPLENIGEPQILQYISDRTSPDHAQVASDADYTDEYNEEIRRLEAEDPNAEVTEETATTTTEEPEEEPTTTTTEDDPATNNPTEPTA